jgi:bifunctional DNA-binding transcriptional regulator/antitoxin component of YhaV-PrlF toxin-antitoxin module
LKEVGLDIKEEDRVYIESNQNDGQDVEIKKVKKKKRVLKKKKPKKVQVVDTDQLNIVEPDEIR